MKAHRNASSHSVLSLKAVNTLDPSDAPVLYQAEMTFVKAETHGWDDEGHVKLTLVQGERHKYKGRLRGTNAYLRSNILPFIARTSLGWCSLHRGLIYQFRELLQEVNATHQREEDTCTDPRQKSSSFMASESMSWLEQPAICKPCTSPWASWCNAQQLHLKSWYPPSTKTCTKT